MLLILRRVLHDEHGSEIMLEWLALILECRAAEGRFSAREG
jgi:hypothetical protein